MNMRIIYAIIAGCGLTIVLPGTAAEPEAIKPDKVIQLFNGQDLGGLYSWLKDTPTGDPKKVFSVQDGLLRISGESDGYIGTTAEYRDYHLVVEFKWGRETYGAKFVRNSGILLHGVGDNGTAPGGWITSLECQVAQGCVGDFIVIRGKDAEGKTIPATLTSDTVLGSDGKTRWQLGGKPTKYSGRQFWWSKHDPTFQELIDTRGKDDVEKPLGEWNRIECICHGDRIAIDVNGARVNECYDCYPQAGKILLESEGFELFVRKLELRPLAE